MSIERDAVLFYGVQVSADEARERLRAAGAYADGDEPVWDLAIHLDLQHTVVGNAWEDGVMAWYIGPKLVFDNENARISVDPAELERLRAAFPDRAAVWVRGEFVH